MADQLKQQSNGPGFKDVLALFTYEGQAKRYKPVHGARLPLLPMLETLRDVSPEAWGAYAFARDPLRDKYTPEEALDLTRKALACGHEEAEKLVNRRGGRADPTLIAKELGLQIKRPDMPNGGGNVVFAQYVEPDEITVFMDTVDKAEKLLSERPDIVRFLGKRSVEQVLVAHELFHAVELRNKDTVFTQTYRIRLWKIGPLKNESKLGCLAEIAGMEFARTLLNLPFFPYVYDVLLVSLYDPAAASDLYRSICKMCGAVNIETTMSNFELADALKADTGDLD